MGQVVGTGAMYAAGISFLGASYVFWQRHLASKAIQTHKLDFKEHSSGDLSKYAITVYPPYGIVNRNGDIEVQPGAPIVHISNKDSERVLNPPCADLESMIQYFHTCLKTASLFHSQNFCWEDFKRMRDAWEIQECETGNFGIAGIHFPQDVQKRKTHSFGETLIHAFDLKKYLWSDLSAGDALKDLPKPKTKEEEAKVEYLAQAMAIGLGHGLSLSHLYYNGLSINPFALKPNGAIAFSYTPTSVITSEGTLKGPLRPESNRYDSALLGNVRMLRIQLDENSLTYKIVYGIDGQTLPEPIYNSRTVKPNNLEWLGLRDPVLRRTCELAKSKLKV